MRKQTCSVNFHWTVRHEFAQIIQRDVRIGGHNPESVLFLLHHIFLSFSHVPIVAVQIFGYDHEIEVVPLRPSTQFRLRLVGETTGVNIGLRELVNWASNACEQKTAVEG